ncbi:hypothetical protein A2U01_0083352 [Trifolium medium]|uniref:Uncharacterized protein n=1 Tax=Trifolium medium TaxID=97028 RepID=A0A392TQH1_9FABA|nr:hypothetical protein [Trifolium medium]
MEGPWVVVQKPRRGRRGQNNTGTVAGTSGFKILENITEGANIDGDNYENPNSSASQVNAIEVIKEGQLRVRK